MAEHVLGKVTGDYGHPGAPDALLDIVVDPRWLREARTIEVDLPRHLSCASCRGAGCDVCAQSGALTVRERFEPPEVVRLTLPRHDMGSDSSPESQRTSVLLRIQGRGGLPASGSEATQRGRLLLRLQFTGPISDCVREVPEEQVTSSSKLNLADFVSNDEIVPSSAISPIDVSQRTLISQKSEPPSKAGLKQQAPLPQGRQPVRPQVQRGSPPLHAQAPAKSARSRSMNANFLGRFSWIDIAIGLIVTLIGAAVAWFLV